MMQRLLLRVVMAPPWAAICWNSYLPKLYAGRRPADFALNARFLQKTGTGTPASIAAVGVNSLAGAVMQLVLMVVLFALAGHGLSQAFKLPPGGRILLILPVIIAVIGVILATRPGRRRCWVTASSRLRRPTTSAKTHRASAGH